MKFANRDPVIVHLSELDGTVCWRGDRSAAMSIGQELGRLWSEYSCGCVGDVCVDCIEE